MASEGGGRNRVPPPHPSPRGPQEAPKRPQGALKRPLRSPKRPQRSLQEVPRSPLEASNLPPGGPKEANHELPTNIQDTSDPSPKHGGGIGRRPLDLRRHGNGKSASGTCPRWLMAPFALGSLGVQSLLRHRSLLGALVFRACYVLARCWEPWCSEIVTLPLALGSLGAQTLLRHRSLSGALVLRA